MKTHTTGESPSKSPKSPSTAVNGETPQLDMPDIPLSAAPPSPMDAPNEPLPAFVMPDQQHNFAMPELFGADYPLDSSLGPMFGDNPLANLPSMDSQFWADIDIDWEDPLDRFVPTYKSPSTSSQQAYDSPYDRIERHWPKLGLVYEDAMPTLRDGQPQTWTQAYQEMRRSGIDLQPIEPPSTAFLSAAVYAYFRSFHPDQPFVHQSTFDAQSCTPLYALAVCATGARFMGSEQAATFARQCFERIGLLLQVLGLLS